MIITYRHCRLIIYLLRASERVIIQTLSAETFKDSKTTWEKDEMWFHIPSPVISTSSQKNVLCLEFKIHSARRTSQETNAPSQETNAAPMSDSRLIINASFCSHRRSPSVHVLHLPQRSHSRPAGGYLPPVKHAIQRTSRPNEVAAPSAHESFPTRYNATKASGSGTITWASFATNYETPDDFSTPGQRRPDTTSQRPDNFEPNIRIVFYY